MSDPHAKQTEDAPESRLKASRRRDKPQLSCTLCRQKKLKCDRNQPCKNCEKRPLGSCVYVHSLHSASGGKKVIDRAPNVNSQNRNISVQDRIRRLERLVVSLAGTPDAVGFDGQRRDQQDPSAEEPQVAEPDRAEAGSHDVSRHFGRLSVDDSETRFVNPSHWESILEDISEIKDAISSPPSTNSWPRTLQSSEPVQGPELIFGERERISAKEIICSLPSKAIIDELIQLFLKAIDIPPLTIHVPTFQKEYESFWKSPESVSVTWLGLLHTLMALALQFLHRTGTGGIEGIHFPEAMAQLFTKRAAQCLILADYTKPTHYTVETMIMYMACEHFINPEAEFRSSLVYGIIVRVAMRSGFHRDPIHYAQMSIFEGEMRRRIWALIMQLDLIFASSLGLPRLLDHRQIDTAPPLNVLDEDIYPDMTELPKPRPDTEQTWTGYMNFKTKMLTVLGSVVDCTNSVQEPSYNEVLRLDKEIQAVDACKPTWLELPSDGYLATLPVSALTRLVGLDLVSQRARMTLHRKYLTMARVNRTYSYSRQACLAAATQALQYQWELFDLSRVPDGLLSSSWKFFSLMTHDFLLAAMIVCLDLDQALLYNDTECEPEERDVRRKRYELLQSSFKVWTESADHSQEAKKAADVLRIMLDRVERKKVELRRAASGSSRHETPSTASENMRASSDASSATYERYGDPNLQPWRMVEAKSVPGPVGFNGMPIDDANLYLAKSGLAYPEAQAFQNMLSSPTNFDWLDWDSQFPTQGLDFQT